VVQVESTGDVTGATGDVTGATGEEDTGATTGTLGTSEPEVEGED